MKNPSILEGGIARAFSAIRKLFTRQSGSDDLIAWVPESDRQLTTKYITQNGVYRASDDGYYAYSSVTVNVSTTDSVSGKDPVTGEDVVVKPDPQTGELVETVVPSEIRVITPPTNPYGIYKDGQTVGTEGMVVKAYLASGEEYGTVPVGEVTIEPTTAVYDASSDYGEATSSLETEFPQPIPMTYGPIQVYSTDAHDPEQMYDFNGNYLKSCVYKDVGQWIQYDYVQATDQPKSGSWSSYTYAGKTVYYYAMSFPGYGMAAGVGQPVDTIIEGSLAATAWTMIYGEHSQAGSHQSITVTWPRPGDGAVLETSFEILVAPPIYGGSEN